MWLEAVKMYGNRPMKLLIRINKNRAINIRVAPLVKGEWPKRVLNSWWRVPVIFVKIMFFLVGIVQKIGVSTIKNTIALNQFREAPHSAVGSKLEKRLAIMISKLGGKQRLP
jgi:hypothetical protein